MKRLILSGAAVLAAALALPARAADPEIKFEKYKLANGLTVILSEDHRIPQVAVSVWYHVGAANQTPGKSGFAHLFEHMMFSGSKHVRPSPFAVLQSIGTTPGSMANGSTNLDRTNYHEVVASNELATALWIESDRMGFLLDTLDAGKLKIQRDVVSNERRERYENRAYGLADLHVCDLLYPLPHPYYDCTIGLISEIQAASVDDLKAFFRDWYGPQNASLAIVGDLDPAAAKSLVEKYFGPIVNDPMPPRPEIPQPLLTQVIAENLEDKLAELPRVQLEWNGLKRYADDEPAGDVLASILGEGKTSRLYKSLVFDKELASEVSASNTGAGLGGYFEVRATVKAGHGREELMPLIEAELDRLKQEGPAAAEVARAQRQSIAAKVRNVEGLAGRAEILNEYETYLGDPGYLPRELASIRAVTPEAVKAFANKYLPDGKRLELTTVPVAKSQGSAK